MTKKRCYKCNKWKPLCEYSPDPRKKGGTQARCKSCMAEWQRKYRATSRGKTATEDTNLRRRYGLSMDEYNAILAAQDGLCAICKGPPGARRLAVDHDHETGEVRGLLCPNCNRGIGNFRDDPSLLRAAIEYLSARLDVTYEDLP